MSSPESYGKWYNVDAETGICKHPVKILQQRSSTAGRIRFLALLTRDCATA